MGQKSMCRMDVRPGINTFFGHLLKILVGSTLTRYKMKLSVICPIRAEKTGF